jgi:hypothetical protein
MTSMQPGDPRVAADVLAEEAAAAGSQPVAEGKTVPELRKLAEERGIDLAGANTKDQILARLTGNVEPSQPAEQQEQS